MLTHVRRAWPLGLVLGLALGTIVVVGANYSNSFPSRAQPFGWPGAANFENAVAMVRNDLVLATTVPALLLGASVWRSGTRMGPTYARDALALTAGVGLGTLIGGVGTEAAPQTAYAAFFVAHTLLALSFYSIAALCSAVARQHAIAVAFAIWIGLISVFEAAIRTIVFRQAGYDALASGQFPSWFYAAQGGSPIAAYRGVLILWDQKFMDGLEKAVLGQATLPSWLTAWSMGALLVVVWIALPLALASLIHVWRTRSIDTKTRADPA